MRKSIMSHNGPEEFSPNEREKFEEIFQAHRNHQDKKVKKLVANLTPLEEDRYDLYLRAAEEAITTGKSAILHQRVQVKSSSSPEESAPKSANDRKNRGGCNMM